jgi:hypothetical protein
MAPSLFNGYRLVSLRAAELVLERMPYTGITHNIFTKAAFG